MPPTAAHSYSWLHLQHIYCLATTCSITFSPPPCWSDDPLRGNDLNLRLFKNPPEPGNQRSASKVPGLQILSAPHLLSARHLSILNDSLNIIRDNRKRLDPQRAQQGSHVVLTPCVCVCVGGSTQYKTLFKTYDLMNCGPCWMMIVH